MHQNILREIARDLLFCIKNNLGEQYLKECFDVACLKQPTSITMGIQIPFPCPIALDHVIRDSAIAYVGRQMAVKILSINKPVRFIYPVTIDSNAQILKDSGSANLSLALLDNMDTPNAAVWVEYTPD